MAIWTKTISAPSDLSVPAISENIGFQAQSIVVDNFTPYWLYIPSSLGYIPPWTTDVVRGLIHATDFVKVEWRSPFGDTQVVQSTAKFVSFLFTDAIIPSAPGTLAYGTAQLTTTSLPILYNVVNNSTFLGNINAFYNLATPMQLLSVDVTNNSGTTITPSIVRLTNDIVSGGISASIVVPDPTNPSFNGNADQNLNSSNISNPLITQGTQTTSNILTITLPANIPDNSLILIAYSIYGSGSYVTIPPSNYTLLFSRTEGLGTLYVYYKIGTPIDSNTDVSITFNSIGYNKIAHVVVTPLLLQTNSISYNTNSSGGTAGTTAVFNSVTPSNAPQYILGISTWIADNKSTVTITPSSGYTELVDYWGLEIEYITNYSTSPITPGNTVANVSLNWITATISIPIKTLTMNKGDNLYTLNSIPTGTTLSTDLSTEGIIGRIGNGLGIVTDITDFTKTITVKSKFKVVS